MAEKFQTITELYESTAKAVTATPSHWGAFLTFACRNYRLSFDEQLLVYAQRPDATAVLELERWNQRFGRWVNRGARGIAVFDRERPTRLRYYFDVSDTHETRMSRPVPLWTVREEYAPDIIETLENTFGELEHREDLGDALLSTARNAVEDNMGDYLAELEQLTQGSLLEELDGDNLALQFRTVLGNSVAAMLLARCGIDPASYLEDEDFRDVGNFNTPETHNALGVATRDIARMCLDEIARTVISLERQAQKENRTLADSPTNLYAETREPENLPERSQHYGSDLHHAGELLDARPSAAPGGADFPGQVRPDAETLFAGAPENHLHQPADQREAFQPSGGDSADRPAPDGADRGADGQGSGRDGGTESQRPDEMGADDEQPAQCSGGNSAGGANLQLNTPQDSGDIQRPSQESQQMSLFDFAAFQQPAQAEGTAQPSIFPHPALPQQVIDEALCIGANDQNSRLIICAYFKKDKPDNARFLAEHYGENGAGFYLDGRQYAIWYNAEGIRIAQGESAQRSSATLISWEQAAARIRELLDLGRYMPQSELDRVDGYERQQRAAQLWYLRQDFAEGTADAGYLPTVNAIYGKNHGFPEESAAISDLLGHPEGLQNLRDELEQFVQAYRENRELLRFRFHRPQRLLEQLSDLQREPLHFTAVEGYDPQRRFFISGDEIDNLLRGGKGNTDYRLAVYSFYRNHTERKEREDFLKHYHGEYSGHSGGNDDVTYQLSKGVSFSHGSITAPYAKVELKWPAVEKRVSAMIAQGRFLTDEDRAAMPQYEKHQLARNIRAFFENVPQEQPHPYPFGFDYWDAVKLIEPQLDDLARVEEIYQMMVPIWEATPQDDRRYDLRRQVFENFTAFRQGTFTLFAEHKEPVVPTMPQTKAYDLGYGHLGNGLTVWNRLEEEHGDYKTVAHIAPDRTVTFYEEEMPQAVREEIQRIADTSEMAISATQDAPVFAVPPRVQEPPQREEAAEGSYQLLSRLKADCDYFLGAGGRAEKHLWAGNVREQIAKMRELYNALPDKPEWLTMEDIDRYAQRMEPPYEVVVYHHFENGFDERMDYQTLAEAERVAQKYVAGTMEGEDGFAYDGAGIYDFQENRWLRVYGNFPDERAMEQAKQAPAAEEPLTGPEQAGLQPKKEELLPPPPTRPRREGITFTTLHPESPPEQRRNFRITDGHLGEGGAKTKFHNNVTAIQTLRKIESEGRLATPEEQEILSRYVGWGGLPQAFDENNPQWAEEFTQLQKLLSPEEYEAAKATTLNAHYTSPTVIQAIYQAVENMGFRTGNILEPSCGIGNFFGLVPESMKDSHLYGVELDPLTGRIAQQLYQQNSIAVQGFENTELPDSFFDLAIGNVPFGSYSLHDKRYDKHHFLIHDYFFAKTLDKVRPGGIVAFITSKGTLDKQNPSVRKYIAERAQLIGAIRLPNNAFLANAGTQVTTDILFLQKREKLVDVSLPEPDAALEWLHLGQTEDGVPVNQYFLDHPEMLLGQMAFDRSMYGNEKETTCKPLEDAGLSDLLAKAVENLHAQYTPYEIEEREGEDTSIPADPTVRNFSYTIADGQVYYRENSRMFPVEASLTAENRIRGMIALRDCARSLIEVQMGNGSEEAVQTGQQELNRLYDSFTAQYGLLNSRANTTVFSADSSFPLLCSLEILDEQRNLKQKADLFTKRTIQPYRVVTHVDTASEALAVSIGEKARVDLEYMGSLTGKTQEQLAEELRGVIFPVPGEVETNGKPHYVTADEYLSGNVREKLRQARAAEEASPTYTTNVEALEKVQPKDLTAGEINVRLGATWIPEDVAEQFTHELLQTPFYYKSRIRVRYSSVTGEWNVSEKSLDRSSIRVFNTYGTKRVNAYKLIEDILNLRDVRVFDTVQDENGKEQRVLNKKETAIAQDKQDQIKEKFQEWVWADPTRRERLCTLYNAKFNAIRPREYDGSHLVFAGMNPEITLRPHQRNAVARAIYGGNALFAHVVGAGKTYEMIAAAMESKRLGLSSKALFVVPNHIIGDFASDFLDLYPGANILVATKKDFEKQRRKKFCARIATGDYDGIILGHSQFEKIPLSTERQQAMLKRQIAEVVAGIQAAKKQEGSRFTVKQMEKSKKSLEAKLKKLHDQSAKDDVVTFEELGVDRLFIDEADLFKNLYLYTKMRNVGGISQTESLKASDLYMKCQYMDELTGGKGVVFATGTPVSNSMAELYTMQRYLQGNLLKELGLSHFDAWASQFGETVTSMELKPEGQGFQQKTRFSNFYNLPELMALFKEVADIQTADMLNLPVPKAKYETVVCKPSDIQKEMVEALGQRADAVRSGAVDASQDNMLLITNDGRKLALDQRLLTPLLPDVEGSKVNVCAEKVYQIWKDTQKDRLTQLVFCDLSTPKTDGTFSVYNDLKDKLMARGIPEKEIAFVHSAANEAQKQQLFGKVRAGQVRVLLGSTAKMGAGTNVQDKLIALHDLDCPWRPRDLEQRSGRIIRQGNQNPEVQIYRYVTEGTFDSYLYQMVENKQRFISQVFTSKAPARVMQEIDDVVLSYNEIKALATGNPQIIERANLETEVNKLKMLRASFLSQRYELEDKVLKYYPKEIQQYEERIARTTADIARRDKNTPAEGFPPMNVKGIAYTEKAQAGQALLDACSQIESTELVSVGFYRGFGMELSYEAFSKEYQVSLKGALSHRVSLGTDVFGNITRLDNALNGLEQRLESNREALERTKEQMVVAQAESEKPFPREQELREKSQRLAELTKLLKLDEKDRELLDSVPDEGEEAPARKVVGRER